MGWGSPDDQLRAPARASTQLSCGDCTTVVPAHLCYRFRVCFLVGTEEAAMANFVRSATIMLMGATVVAAGVVVVLYN